MSPETYQLAPDQLQISAEGKHVKQHELGDHLCSLWEVVEIIANQNIIPLVVRMVVLASVVLITIQSAFSLQDNC